MNDNCFDRLSVTLDRIIKWIENCDSKASTILNVEGIILSVFLVTDYIRKIYTIFKYMTDKLNIWTGLYLLIFISSISMILIGTTVLIRVLNAKINPNEYLTKGVKKDSLIYFASIAENESLESYSIKIKDCSPKEMEDDIISQIYICSLICKVKFDLYKKGVVIVQSGFVIFMITLIIGGVIV